jgi:hypothetical protein
MDYAPEFKSFSEIKHLSKLQMCITQKLHGSNSQILIYQKEDGSLDLVCGIRTRWVYPHSDNYGFATFVHQHKEEFITKLGLGRHFGEWVGPGINSGEGLKEKTLVLFDALRWEGHPLPPRTVLVPVLYLGDLDLTRVDGVMDDLKKDGSKLVPGFMRPEGIVVQFAGLRFKKVFDAEETQWVKSEGNKGQNPKVKVDFTHLCQPIRLEKLLSRDEEYVKNYPENLPTLVKLYIEDLLKENQIEGTEDERKTIAKAASGQLFRFIKTVVDQTRAIGI